MSSERNIDPFAVMILVLSVIGLILLAALDFAAFDLNGSGTRWSCLSCEYSTTGDIIAQVVILILLILQIVIALNELLPKRLIEKDLNLIGMILACLTILFVIIGIASFGIEYSEYYWWPETGFYGAIIAGILNLALFFLKFKNR
ncbi:MAG: hypothetical protein CEE43_04800 [Promethearchaeota archaeon Loki_b32]|nr:MAG: hypothetical protein CEE43_04800 [Candidatus Lokiarchaeota archaeon Loki_b32]